MKKLFSAFVLMAIILSGSVFCEAAPPRRKKSTKPRTAVSMTPKKLIDLIESRESAKITDINSLASEIDRARSITADGLERLIAAKYPAYAKKPLGEKLAQGRKAVENYIRNNNDYNSTTAGMAAGAYALCAFSDYSSLALLGELLEKMPTIEARQKFLEFGVQLSIFQNNASNLTYYHAAFEMGFGSFLSLFSASSIDEINVGTRKMLLADLNALASGTVTSSDNPATLFRKFVDKNSMSTIDPDNLNDLKETYEDAYRDYRSVSENIDTDYARLAQAHIAWLETLPKKQADAMTNSLAILLEACIQIED